jgi:hypothetical protein
MNTFSYLIYLAITYWVTVHVGWIFYKNGRVYILSLLKGDQSITDAINRLLLTGYYLVNLGYAAWMIHLWQPVHTLTEMVETVGLMVSRILLTLGLLHFLNMAVIYRLSKKETFIQHHKTV